MFDFLKKIVSYGKIEDYPVKLVDEFIFNVPQNYTHSKQLSVFKEYAKEAGISCSDLLSDENFKNISYELEPGQQYVARIFRVGKHYSHYQHPDRHPVFDTHSYIKTIKTYDCVNFLNGQISKYSNSHLVGAQGLSFLWQFIKKENLKDGSPVLALDEFNIILANGDRVAAFSEKYGNCHVVVPCAHSGEKDGIWDPGIHFAYVSKITEITKQHFNESGIRKHTDNFMNYNVDENPKLSDIDDKTKEIYELADKFRNKDKNSSDIPDDVLVKTDTLFKIPSTDGKRNIANSKDDFRIVFFEEEELDKSDFISKPTADTNSRVYSLVKDTTIYKMFKSLSKDLNTVCFTQAQILTFLEEYRNELVGTWHFMYKTANGFMFMQVCMDDDGSMRLFGGDFEADGLDYIYKATGVNFRFLVPEK